MRCNISKFERAGTDLEGSCMMEALSACFLASSSWPDLRIEALDAGPSTISPDYLQVAPATATFFHKTARHGDYCERWSVPQALRLPRLGSLRLAGELRVRKTESCIPWPAVSARHWGNRCL